MYIFPSWRHPCSHPHSSSQILKTQPAFPWITSLHWSLMLHIRCKNGEWALGHSMLSRSLGPLHHMLECWSSCSTLILVSAVHPVRRPVTSQVLCPCHLHRRLRMNSVSGFCTHLGSQPEDRTFLSLFPFTPDILSFSRLKFLKQFENMSLPDIGTLCLNTKLLRVHSQGPVR